VTDTTVYADWIKEGHFVSLLHQEQRFYYHVIQRDFAHIEYTWEESINTLSFSGPYRIADLEMTKNWKHLHQLIFGIRPQVLIYVHIPTDMDRHGTPKKPRQTPTQRTIGHYNMWMSPWDQPSWYTEHFMWGPDIVDMNLSCYNPTEITVTPEINFFLNKLLLEEIGRESPDGTWTWGDQTEDAGVRAKMMAKWGETQQKLAKRLAPCRHLTLMSIRAPAAAI